LRSTADSKARGQTEATGLKIQGILQTRGGESHNRERSMREYLASGRDEIQELLASNAATSAKLSGHSRQIKKGRMPKYFSIGEAGKIIRGVTTMDRNIVNQKNITFQGVRWKMGGG